MGQFKPMVKMMTTEPSVELKLKKGGAVMMKKGGATKVEKKAIGGGLRQMMGRVAPMIRQKVTEVDAATPARPAMGERLRAMAPKMLAAIRGKAAGRMMKEGGETKMEHMAEKKEMKGMKAALKEHADKPASKAHKGLKTGGVALGQGGYKKGGKVKKYAKGGLAKSGIITEEEGSRDAGPYKDTLMHTAKPDHSPAKTGEVKLGNAGGYKTGGVIKGQGGYKKGGAAKKYAKGGSVNDSGKAEKMPQGQKKPSAPVSISKLSGTFRKGGSVMTPAEAKLHAIHEGENAPAMKAAKSHDEEIYSKYGKMKMRYGGSC